MPPPSAPSSRPPIEPDRLARELLAAGPMRGSTVDRLHLCGTLMECLGYQLSAESYGSEHDAPRRAAAAAEQAADIAAALAAYLRAVLEARAADAASSKAQTQTGTAKQKERRA